MPTTIDIESQRMLLGSTPVRKIYQGTNLLGMRIAELFASGEQGVWYDPSDLSTLYQDAAGTTPVTGVEQPVGLMLDKSKGLTLGPELVTNGDFSNGTTGWTVDAVAPSSVTFSSGSVTLYRDAASSDPAIVNIGEGVLGKTYLVTFDVLSVSDQTKNIGVRFGQTGTIYPLSMIGPPGKKRFIVTANGSGLIAIRQGGNGPSTIVLDNISIRELPGNHAYQPTATSRPVLSARVNLLTKTEQFDDAAWPKQGGLVAITPNAALAPNGTMTADLAVWSGFGSLYQGPIAGVAGVIYVARVWVKGESGKTISVWFDTGTLSVNRQRYLLTGEWQEIVLQSTYNGTGGINLAVRKDSSLDTASEVLVWGADLRVANTGVNLPPYQRVNTATDYDTVGFPHYLRFDGVDDWLVTNTITPGIDKVQVFAGVRRLSPTVVEILAELSVISATNNGVFALFAQNAPSTYALRSRGAIDTLITSAASYASPITNVLTGLGDISGDSAILRVNGTQAASSTSDQGTGNYLAYPLYIGRRGGTTLPFNGYLYSLIVRFGSNLPAATIEKTEKYINGLTKAY